MSDDEADEVGAAQADAYANEFADDDDYDFGSMSKKQKAAPVPWIQIVKLKFDSATKVADLTALFAAFSAYVQANEPTTLSFSMATSDKDPLSIVLFERFADKDKAYIGVHRSSSEYVKFTLGLKKLAPVQETNGYFDTVGFVGR